MAANITASAGTPDLEFIRSGRARELVKLVGSSTAAADTSNAYQSRLQAPSKVEGGAFAISVSGTQVTFTALLALGSNTVYVWISE